MPQLEHAELGQTTYIVCFLPQATDITIFISINTQPAAIKQWWSQVTTGSACEGNTAWVCEGFITTSPIRNQPNPTSYQLKR